MKAAKSEVLRMHGQLTRGPLALTPSCKPQRREYMARSRKRGILKYVLWGFDFETEKERFLIGTYSEQQANHYTGQAATILFKLCALAQKNGDKRLRFKSTYDLAKALGMGTGGRSYDDIWRAIELWGDTRIVVFNKEGGGRLVIPSPFSAYEEKNSGEVIIHVCDRFMEKIINPARLSVSIMGKLERNVAAQNLYRFLENWRGGQNEVFQDLQEMCKLIGLAESSDLQYLRKKVREATDAVNKAIGEERYAVTFPTPKASPNMPKKLVKFKILE